MSEPTADIALLTPVPEVHLQEGLKTCETTGFVAFGTEAGMVLSELRLNVSSGHQADILFYASHPKQVGGAKVVTYRGRFAGYEGSPEAKKKGWDKYRPATTETDGKWPSFYLVSDLQKLENPISIASLPKRNGHGKKLASNFIPIGPTLIDTPF
jgi:hypothetical protein